MLIDDCDGGMGQQAVVLRPIRESDAEAYQAGEDDEIVRWLSGGRAPLAGIRSYFAGLAANAATGRGKRAFGIWVDGRLAGYLEVDPDVRDGLAEGDVNVAYAVLPWARGRGVARDAVRATAARVTADGGRAALRIDTENEASLRVAAAAGFTAVGEIVSATDRRPDGSPALLRIYRAPTEG